MLWAASDPSACETGLSVTGFSRPEPDSEKRTHRDVAKHPKSFTIFFDRGGAEFKGRVFRLHATDGLSWFAAWTIPRENNRLEHMVSRLDDTSISKYRLSQPSLPTSCPLNACGNDSRFVCQTAHGSSAAAKSLTEINPLRMLFQSNSAFAGIDEKKQILGNSDPDHLQT